MKIWVRVNDKWEVFPYDKLTRFVDGKLGFRFTQIIKPMKALTFTENLDLWLKYRDHFEIDEPNARVVLKESK